MGEPCNAALTGVLGGIRMGNQDFLDKMKEVIDTEADLSMDTELKSLEEWDSLSVVSIISVANALFGKRLTAKQITDSGTMADLYNLMQE